MVGATVGRREGRVALLERVRTSIGFSGAPEPTLERTLGMLPDAVRSGRASGTTTARAPIERIIGNSVIGRSVLLR